MVYIQMVLNNILAVIITVTLHEYVKAAASTRLGDPKPKMDGRLTLNPAKHLDALGAICMAIWGLGWGKPVETAPVYYADRKKGILIVYILPSVANMLLGILAAAVLFIFRNMHINFASEMAYGAFSIAVVLLAQIAQINVATALFNIIPVYPLDGYKVLSVCLKPENAVKLTQYEKVFQIILMFGIAGGYIGKMLISPLTNAILKFAY